MGLTFVARRAGKKQASSEAAASIRLDSRKRKKIVRADFVEDLGKHSTDSEREE